MNKKIYKIVLYIILLISISYILKTFVPYKLWFQNITEQEVSYPKSISIPSLNIDADVEYVGKTYAGAMAVPQSISTVGWYKYGTIPGNIGNAVFDGHVDNALGLGGVFQNLSDMRIGNEILISNIDGDEYTYIVDDIENVKWTEADSEKIFDNDNENKRVVLITCAGNWDKTSDTYDDRIIVYATLKE